jgi:hypothetical protein
MTGQRHPHLPPQPLKPKRRAMPQTNKQKPLRRANPSQLPAD